MGDNMELNSIEYNSNSIKYLNQKKILNAIFSVIFAFLTLASIAVFVLLIVYNVKEFAPYLLIVVQILASALYIFTCIITHKETQKQIEKINKEGSFVEKFNQPIKIDYNKKYSNTEILYIVCACILTVFTAFCIVALCLTFSLSTLVDVMFMVLILCFSIFMAITTQIDDTRIKINHITSKVSEKENIDSKK